MVKTANVKPVTTYIDKKRKPFSVSGVFIVQLTSVFFRSHSPAISQHIAGQDLGCQDTLDTRE